MQPKQLKTLVTEVLEESKANDIVVIDVHKFTSITEYMVICSGTSSRHVASIANNAIVKAKARSVMPLGSEGEDTGEWVVVDFGDVILHVMLPQVRDYYNLEALWSDRKPI